MTKQNLSQLKLNLNCSQAMLFSLIAASAILDSCWQFCMLLIIFCWYLLILTSKGIKLNEGRKKERNMVSIFEMDRASLPLYLGSHHNLWH